MEAFERFESFYFIEQDYDNVFRLEVREGDDESSDAMHIELKLDYDSAMLNQAIKDLSEDKGHSISMDLCYYDVLALRNYINALLERFKNLNT